MKTTETMKRLLNKKRGQAFPLAAVGLFIMALSVVATLNLGQAIREKIMLQNTVDAAAYSLAAMEARGFNFVALTNRTQIVHYNAAMAVQSYMSYAQYSLFMLGTLKDLIACVKSSLDWGCSYIPWPPLRAAYCIAARIFQVILMIAYFVALVAGLLFDYIIHLFAPMAIEALGLFNEYILWHTQLIRLVLLNGHIFSGMQEIISSMYTPRGGENRMKFGQGNSLPNVLFNAFLNTLEFRATFDSASGLNPSGVDLLMGLVSGGYSDFKDRKEQKHKDAVRIMTEMANASRSEKSIYDRSGSAFATWIAANIWGDKQGATKFTVKDTPKPEVKKIHVTDNYIQGDYLSSDDFLDNGFGFAFGGLALALAFPNTINKIGSGIVAADEKNDRKHYGYKDNKRKPAHPMGSYNGLFAFPPLKTVAKKSMDKDMDCSGLKAHKWPGIAPYIKYNPRAEHDSDYNQPSTWMFLNIQPEHIQDAATTGSGSTKNPWNMKFKFSHGGTDEFQFSNLSEDSPPWEHGGHSAELNTSIGGGENNHFKLGPLDLAGLNAFSRGMAYYHRPDNWQEHPNFFNPFWRAKLAPIGNKLTQLFDKLTRGIGGSTSGEDGETMNFFKNFIRNFINDIFFAVITSVITH